MAIEWFGYGYNIGLQEIFGVDLVKLIKSFEPCAYKAGNSVFSLFLFKTCERAFDPLFELQGRTTFCFESNHTLQKHSPHIRLQPQILPKKE